MRNQLNDKKRSKRSMPKLLVSFGLVSAAILATSPVFANGLTAYEAQEFGPIAAAIMLASAVSLEIWRRISSQRRLESFVRTIREQ
jgi:hypothetical protein